MAISGSAGSNSTQSPELGTAQENLKNSMVDTLHPVWRYLAFESHAIQVKINQLISNFTLNGQLFGETIEKDPHKMFKKQRYTNTHDWICNGLFRTQKVQEGMFGIHNVREVSKTGSRVAISSTGFRQWLQHVELGNMFAQFVKQTHPVTHLKKSAVNHPLKTTCFRTGLKMEDNENLHIADFQYFR